jgi:hypothetical protein
LILAAASITSAKPQPECRTKRTAPLSSINNRPLECTASRQWRCLQTDEFRDYESSEQNVYADASLVVDTEFEKLVSLPLSPLRIRYTCRRWRMPYRKFDEFIFLHRKEKIADFYALHAKLRLQTFDGDSDLMT